jgi:DNA-binding response OmpR family regulator
MGRILLVEDSASGQVLVRRALEECAEVHVAGTQEEALNMLRRENFDLLIVDVSLPDGDGFGLCATMLAGLSHEPGAPPRPRVLFLTGKGEIADKLTGFSVGGDDYLVKPVDPLELRARVITQLRHCREAALQSSQLRAGNLRIDLAAHQALLDEGGNPRQVSLTPTEYKLLLQLARHESQVFTRDQLLQALSGGRTHVTDRTIDAHLCRLRKKLETCTHSVEPIYGVGYKFARRAA